MRTAAELAQLRETAGDSWNEEEATGDSCCTVYCTEAYNINTTPDSKETFSFPHGAVYCFFHSIQMCKRVHKYKPASSSQANGLLNPQRDKSMRVENVRAGAHLSSLLKPYCTPKDGTHCLCALSLH